MQGTIEEREREFIDDFRELSDWMLQYEFLLCFAEDVNELPETGRTEERRVRGCVSNVWALVTDAPGGGLSIELASDTLIIKGILGVITAIVGDAPRDEIARWQPQFIEATALKAQLGVDRQRGVHSILSEIISASRRGA